MTKLNENDRTRFIQALREYQQAGINSVCCNICNVSIRFHGKGSAIIHECDCGKFNGTLRGL